MITVKDLLVDHLENTFEKETWQPPLATSVWGLTAEQAAWKPAPERHSIWQIVRHVIRWKRGVLDAWDGKPSDFEDVTRGDWQEASGDQAAWDSDVRALRDIYDEFQRRLADADDAVLDRGLPWYRGASQQQRVAQRLMHVFTHDIYHAGQIQYLRALQRIPADRFYTAAWDGDVATLRALLQTDPDLATAYNRDGWTALQIAAYAGQPEAVRVLLESRAEIEAVSRNAMANTPLHAAIVGWQAGQRVAVASMLLEHDADPEALDGGGNTALHLAAHEGAVDVVELLLRHGVDINARRKDGKTPVGVAVDNGRAEAADALRRHGGV
jgi:uncharacterized protein